LRRVRDSAFYRALCDIETPRKSRLSS
jgi:hypothetical protein